MTVPPIPHNFSDPYHWLVLGMQAMRRRVEAAHLGLGGALGVAAEPYPHQLATVKRILTDTRVRHLIADEVGLGKTVEALMILNALRCQNPNHRTAIVVPEQLVKQWYQECWSRGHIHPLVEDSADSAATSWVRIVRPQSIQTNAFRLEAGKFDLLIVDEPQLMPVDVLEAISRVAPDIRQLLLLSATPGLGDPQRRHWIMTLLEPERTGAAVLEGKDPVSELQSLEQQIGARSASERNESNATLFKTFSIDRRICRATRADWGRYLPARRYERIVAEPLLGETERVRLGMNWLMSRTDTAVPGDDWRIAQALHRGRGSLRNVFRSRQEGVDELIQAVRQLEETPGDSRFDALVEILLAVWNERDDEQLIIVAGDNPTIDFLSQRLRRYFGSTERPFEVAELRRSNEAAINETADFQAMKEQLAAFEAGEAKVLLIGEWNQAGLNLHYFARNIVFYSTPWDIHGIDQLIGRLDRLRPNGLFKGDRGSHFGSIRIWSITQADAVESRVVGGIETLGVFEKPLPPMSPDDDAEMIGALEGIAFRGESDRSDVLRDIYMRWNDRGAQSTILNLSPYTAARAQNEYDKLQKAHLPQPLLGFPRGEPTFTTKSEAALRGWTTLIHKAGIFGIGTRTDIDFPEIRFSTFWYGNGGPKNCPFAVPDMSNHWMDGHIPFVSRRMDIEIPPKMTVRTDDGEPAGRPLRFLDHGEPVHEAMVEGFIKEAQTKCDARNLVGRTVTFDAEHPILRKHSGQTLLVLAGMSDPGMAMRAFDSTELDLLVKAAPTVAQKATLSLDAELAQEWWRTDQRWLRAQFPSATLAAVLRLEEDQWEVISGEEKWSILDPLSAGSSSRMANSRSAPIRIKPDLAKAGILLAFKQIAEELKELSHKSSADFRAAVQQRTYEIDREHSDLLNVLAAEVKRRTEAPPAPEQTQQLREGRIAAAERRVAFAQHSGAMRASWLAELPGRVSKAIPKLLGGMIIKPIPFSID